MTVSHPLKRKSVKPSISTVRGMLPGKQFRALDSAMQSLRTAGARLDWQWKGTDVGWVCAGLFDELAICELRPTEEPLLGVIELNVPSLDHVKADKGFPKKYKKILDFPVDSKKGISTFEFQLEDSKHRDFFSDFVENIETSLQGLSKDN